MSPHPTSSPGLVLTLLLAGCSSVSTAIDYQEGFDFATWRTFAWNPGSQDPGLDGLTERRIVEAIGAGLADKGYTEQAQGADFLVAFHAGAEEKVDVTNWGYGYGRGRWYGSTNDVSVRRYTQGTLIVDFVDADTAELVWRGTARATVNPDRTAAEKTQRIQEAVRKLLDGFPPS